MLQKKNEQLKDLRRRLGKWVNEYLVAFEYSAKHTQRWLKIYSKKYYWKTIHICFMLLSDTKTQMTDLKWFIFTVHLPSIAICCDIHKSELTKFNNFTKFNLLFFKWTTKILNQYKNINSDNWRVNVLHGYCTVCIWYTLLMHIVFCRSISASNRNNSTQTFLM